MDSLTWAVPAGVLGVCGLGLVVMYLVPHSVRMVQVHNLRRACRRSGTLTITFDDGPGVELTSKILALLAQYDARATFFLLGKKAERNPSTVDEIVAAGHEVGCHGWGHVNAWRFRPSAAVKDMQRGFDSLAKWVRPDGLFRPPCGKTHLGTWLELRCRRSRAAWWTVDSGDTGARIPLAEKVARQVAAEGGGVVLLHDFDRADAMEAARCRFVLDVTRRLLEWARRESIQVVPLGQVLARGGGVDERPGEARRASAATSGRPT